MTWSIRFPANAGRARRRPDFPDETNAVVLFKDARGFRRGRVSGVFGRTAMDFGGRERINQPPGMERPRPTAWRRRHYPCVDWPSQKQRRGRGGGC